MTDYYAPASAFTDIADAIRTNTGITDTLSWPNGFINAISLYEAPIFDEDKWVERTISMVYVRGVSRLCERVFQRCSNLTTASFPDCQIIDQEAFDYCSILTTISFPLCQIVGFYAFQGCSALTEVSFPACQSISTYAFSGCSNLTTASFPACKSISGYAFRNCYRLKSLYLMGSTLITLAASTAFSSTPIAGYSTYNNNKLGSIYVPASLLASYKTRTNWKYFSARMVGI